MQAEDDRIEWGTIATPLDLARVGVDEQTCLPRLRETERIGALRVAGYSYTCDRDRVRQCGCCPINECLYGELLSLHLSDPITAGEGQLGELLLEGQ